VSETEDGDEPTNKQLANFLVATQPMVEGAEGLRLIPDVLERILAANPHHRAAALKRHREFQDSIVETTKMMHDGTLPCQFRRTNGRMCPNFNKPGTYYCRLHQDPEE